MRLSNCLVDNQFEWFAWLVVFGRLDGQKLIPEKRNQMMDWKKKNKKNKNKKHSENADTSMSLIIVYTKMAQKDNDNQSSLIYFILISV